MKTTEKKKQIKLILTLPIGFYEFLQKQSKNDYMKTATWTKQFLMKNLLGDNKIESNN